MEKEAKIKNIGNAINKMDDALKEMDFTQVPADKLLTLKLKYTEALDKEYTGAGLPYTISKNMDSKEIAYALSDLLNRVRTGAVTTDQAGKELAIINGILKAYEAVDMEKKLDHLEAIVGGLKNA